MKINNSPFIQETIDQLMHIKHYKSNLLIRALKQNLRTDVHKSSTVLSSILSKKIKNKKTPDRLSLILHSKIQYKKH